MIPNRKALVSIGLLVIAGMVQAATSINTCPFAITAPGDYLLAADLICGGGNGISILSSDVTLALEGHRITAGEGANYAISNFSSSGEITRVEHVRVLGPGLITNGGGNAFRIGVFFFHVDNSEVRHSSYWRFPYNHGEHPRAKRLGHHRGGDRIDRRSLQHDFGK